MTSSGKVLIVEDDPFIAIDLEDTLRDAGFEVAEMASSVDQGLEAIRRCNPTLATLDYKLGAETSDEIAAELTRRSIPFCYVSGHSNRLSERDAPVLGKPVAPSVIVRTLNSLVAG